jgi:hypothetical protein
MPPKETSKSDIFGDGRSTQSTPSTKILQSEKQLLGSGRKRIDEVELTRKGLCCVEMAPQSKGIEYAHVIPRSLRDYEENRVSLESFQFSAVLNRGHQLDKLEWWLGMTHGTLNLDTRYNVMLRKWIQQSPG